MSVVKSAFDSGADRVVLCDTNGGRLPDEIREITRDVVTRFKGRDIGIHAHDDCGLAVANTLAAISAGATQVQGTFTGVGERCGNCDLVLLYQI